MAKKAVREMMGIMNVYPGMTSELSTYPENVTSGSVDVLYTSKVLTESRTFFFVKTCTFCLLKYLSLPE